MRVKNSVATRRRRKRVIKQAEGTWGTRHTVFKTAKQTVIRAGEYAFRDRRVKKRDFRKLWITRINAALNEYDISYSKFMHALKLANIEINRKVLSEMAIHNPQEFKNLVESVKSKVAKH
jgi:large subunit ribosomal protein L20